MSFYLKGIQLYKKIRLKISNNVHLLFCSILAGFIIILLFSVSVSPILGEMGEDSPLFMLLGKLILHGERLYVDVFDHKGPIIFWINAVGMLLPDTWGIFLIESFFLGLTLAFTYKISALFIVNRLRIVPIICYIFFFVFTMRDGNSINEYANLPLTAALYYQMKYYCSKQIQHPYRYAFFYGICIAWIAFMRISNCLFLFGMIIAILWRLLIHKEFKNAGMNIVFGLAGISFLAIPICFVFLLSNSLYEMIYATFLFNMKYSGYASTVVQEKNIIINGMLFAAASLIPILLFFPKDYRELQLPLLLGGILAAMGLFIGVGYLNYSMMMLPVSFMEIVFCCMYLKGKHIIVILLVLLAYQHYGESFRMRYLRVKITRSPYLIQDVLPISATENNQVLGINISFYWYLKNDIIPPYKYLGNQTWWSVMDHQISRSIELLLKSDDAPKWIITEANNEYLKKVIHKFYKAVYSDVNYNLYERK